MTQEIASNKAHVFRGGSKSCIDLRHTKQTVKTFHEILDILTQIQISHKSEQVTENQQLVQIYEKIIYLEENLNDLNNTLVGMFQMTQQTNNLLDASIPHKGKYRRCSFPFSGSSGRKGYVSSLQIKLAEPRNSDTMYFHS